MIRRLFSVLAISSTMFLSGCETLDGATRADAQGEADILLEEGYHYPKPIGAEVRETIVTDVEPPPFEIRVQVVTNIVNVNAARPFPPIFFALGEGDNHEVLVLMNTGQTELDTVYHARAAVDQLSSLVRNNPLFAQYGVEAYASIFDLLKIWGFEMVVITDGDEFAYAFVVE
ncbi:MAG: hypothetical protein AAF613_05485 [Pseudomonadota bacterium]